MENKFKWYAFCQKEKYEGKEQWYNKASLHILL